MAKKNRKSNKQLPMVSVCTPTYNRRPFIPSMLKCFEHQIYPKKRIEWIIIDDGTDQIDDLVNDPNFIRIGELLAEKRRLQQIEDSKKYDKYGNKSTS